RGMLDDTLVIFTSDHGEWLGTYGRYGKGHPADDTISRVPLIMRPPASTGRVESVVSTIVEAIDVLPTVLDTAMIPIPPRLQGRSLLPLARGQASSHPGSAITEHRGWKTLRTHGYRYLIESSGREYLFHLESDPHGQHDVSADPLHAVSLGEHRRLLLQRLIERERPRPRTWTY
ncbi:MAG TPA: sulfatase/phosphatase domain-containing protein, partial [Thermomicrobiales bacterium]|nr:sulfatase/phosphatase domain-containing protein [Thermomicrobiales bacterium]